MNQAMNRGARLIQQYVMTQNFKLYSVLGNKFINKYVKVLVFSVKCAVMGWRAMLLGG